jgi:hypothetical protein
MLPEVRLPRLLFEFLDTYENSIVLKKPEDGDSAVAGLRKTLTLAWQSLPADQRQANEKELAIALEGLKGKRFNGRYRDWPPTFVSRPCDPQIKQP